MQIIFRKVYTLIFEKNFRRNYYTRQEQPDSPTLAGMWERLKLRFTFDIGKYDKRVKISLKQYQQFSKWIS